MSATSVFHFTKGQILLDSVGSLAAPTPFELPPSIGLVSAVMLTEGT
jgi:hypothetical protein